MIKAEIIDSNELKSMHIKYDHRIGMYVNEAYHMTLFRIEGLEHGNEFREVFKRVGEVKEEGKGLVMECDFMDVSTRGHFDGTNFYMPLCRVGLRDEKIKAEELKGEEMKKEESFDK